VRTRHTGQFKLTALREKPQPAAGSASTMAHWIPLCLAASGLRLPMRAGDAIALNLQQMFLGAYLPFFNLPTALVV
jgi:hypothetical protein